MVGPWEEDADDCMTPAFISALNSPVRREALRQMHRDPSLLTATQISRKMRTVSAQLVSHHLDVLRKKELTRFVGSKPARGGLEKFFVSEVADHAQVLRILADTEGDDVSFRR
jgi:DNA-binding transcriptional ArsR family regulator